MPDSALPAGHQANPPADELPARIASLTERLRNAASDEPRGAEMTQLLADVAVIVTQLRTRSNELAGSLDRAAGGIRSALDRVSERQ